MERNELLGLLETEGIPYEMDEHKAVYNMEELKEVTLRYPLDDAKNLFVRDDKHRCFYLITLRGDKKADLRKIRKEQKTRPLSFASAEELMEILHLEQGSVTPFGLLNDRDHKAILFLDEDCLRAGRIGVHPNDNTATLWLETKDLIRLLTMHGCEVRVISI